MTHITAKVLIRILGILFITLGVFGVAFVALTFLLVIAGAPSGITQNLLPHAVASLVSSPVWILGGFVVIKFAPRLAALAEKESNNT